MGRSRSPSKDVREKKQMKKKRRKSSSSSSSTSSSSSRSRSRSSKKKTHKKKQDLNTKRKKRRTRSSSSSSTSSSSSSTSSSSSSSDERSRKKKMKAKKKKLMKKKAELKKQKKMEKKQKKIKKREKKMKKELEVGTVQIPAENQPPSYLEVWQNDEEAVELGPVMTDEQKARLSTKRPLTKEEYEARQSVIRRVVDPETGRTRLVRGEGEIIEEIVSKEKHKEINKQSTKGDGNAFQRKLGIMG
ncbi:ADP-ribosylation factor-like protein 6-interacting protein 4 [Oryzias latipes]|uniref:ADP-ribosylation factor-like protein 6-interacting protein 4 n=2 Tax=Oryzias TaxID=8089 RepID=H2LP30_ORYLA|nr:ADP-ribosylation factor-like protein 6-interacting protein 4 [Oryzias latipes]